MQSSSHLSLFFVSCGPQTLHCWEIPWESDKSKSIDINRIGKTSDLKETHQNFWRKPSPRSSSHVISKMAFVMSSPSFPPKGFPLPTKFIPLSSRVQPATGCFHLCSSSRSFFQTFRFNWFRPRVVDAQKVNFTTTSTKDGTAARDDSSFCRQGLDSPAGNMGVFVPEIP